MDWISLPGSIVLTFSQCIPSHTLGYPPMPTRRPQTNLRVRLFAIVTPTDRYSCRGPPRLHLNPGSIGVHVHGDWSGRAVSASRGDWGDGPKSEQIVVTPSRKRDFRFMQILSRGIVAMLAVAV